MEVQRLVPRRREEIEEAHIVSAGVRAIARADASIVDLRIETFFGVRARIGWAHGLAGGCIALLAEHGTEFHFDVREFSFPVAFDANPVHGSSTGGFGCATVGMLFSE
jgi:hypothetical protein